MFIVLSFKLVKVFVGLVGGVCSTTLSTLLGVLIRLEAVNGVLFSAFVASGQTCVSGKRMLGQMGWMVVGGGTVLEAFV